MRNIFMILFLLLTGTTAMIARANPAPVFIVAGQSNTDGRVPLSDMPEEMKGGYKYCKWSYGSGTNAASGEFTTFWPKTFYPKTPELWGYDAVVYHLLEKSLKSNFYIIKESLGGTAISPKAKKSAHGMYWSADKAFLDSTTTASNGGRSLTKALCEHIDRCIDNHLSKLKQGYDIKALLWHQGESDMQQGKDYERNLKQVIAYIRQHLVNKTGNEKYAALPVVIGGISHHSRNYINRVERAQIALSEKDENIYLVDVFDATLLKDRLHFNHEGAQLLGRKVYNQLVDMGVAGEEAKHVAVSQKYRKIMLRPDGRAYMLAYFAENPDGRAVVACPGGGYAHLALKTEGTSWAEYYNKQGITYFVLKYRMPHGKRSLPVSDAEAAIRTVRDSAEVWHINPKKIGIMGSSAGGHLASTIATHTTEKASRPDFQILFYPVITFGKGCHKGSRKNFLGTEERDADIVARYSNELQTTKDMTPPAIIFLADDDRSVPPATNGRAYHEAMLKNGVASELHAFPKGGHGFGFKKFTHHNEMLNVLKIWLEKRR